MRVTMPPPSTGHGPVRRDVSLREEVIRNTVATGTDTPLDCRSKLHSMGDAPEPAGIASWTVVSASLTTEIVGHVPP